MEMGIGFVLGIIFLEATLFIIGCLSEDEDYIIYVGTGIFLFPATAICAVGRKILIKYFNKKYVRCVFYQKLNDEKKCLDMGIAIVERKNLDKYYWEGENEYFIKPIFYHRCFGTNGIYYEEIVMSYYENNMTLKEQKKRNTRLYRNINLFLRKENENGN